MADIAISRSDTRTLVLAWIIAVKNGPDFYKIYVVSPKQVAGDPQSDSAEYFWK